MRRKKERGNEEKEEEGVRSEEEGVELKKGLDYE